MLKRLLPLPALLVPALLLAGLLPLTHTQAGEDYIDDGSIVSDIEREATTLIQTEATVDNAELQTQLRRRTAALDAPAEGVLVEADEDGQGVYERAADGVLVVSGLYLCGNCDNYHANCASGFIISEDGLAVTNHHVVENADNLTMVARTHDGRVVPIVEVLAANAQDDVALVRLSPEHGPYTALPIARDAEVGERVHAITHPDGRFYCYTSGEVSRFFLEPRRRGAGTRRMQITADYAKGSSGGPILNDQGQVVGMVTSTTSVYYNERNGRQEDLQMVFNNCVPYESILDLFAGAEVDDESP
ncbi:MAG: trypsin-like peptidase domain-containing protein [Planctomycetota bacterium]